MTMTELLEEDRGKLLRQLAEAETPEAAQPVVRKELERILYRYNEACAGEELRTAAGEMIAAADAMAGLIDSVGDVEVWTRRDASAPGASQKRGTCNSPLFFGLAAAAIACAGGAFAVTLVGAPSVAKLINTPLVLALMAASLVCAYLAGRVRGGSLKAPAKEQQMTRCIADGERIFRTMRMMLLVADRSLDERKQMEQAAERSALAGASAGFGQAELQLYSGLLEAAYSGDSDYAFDKLRELRGYLHAKGIDVVDDPQGHPAWFDRMPSMKQGTIRPALAADGKLLKKGMASTGL